MFFQWARLVIGETVFLLPLVLIAGGLLMIATKYHYVAARGIKDMFWVVSLAIFLFLLGISGILGIINSSLKYGGWLGYIISWPLMRYFGFWASFVIFLAPVFIAIVIFWYLLKKPSSFETVYEQEDGKEKKTSIIKKIFTPKFKVKEISSNQEEPQVRNPQAKPSEPKNPQELTPAISAYIPPPIDLLEPERGSPTSGDTKGNSALIKKTFQNFGIDVAMSEINIGPTVTQYSFKPAEGVKLSKITSFSNDLALALAAHPIRIEAPIPGRSLVGVEVPNKIRAQVKLRNMVEGPYFQKSNANLLISLGRDVAGNPVYSDLTRMPHLLVAGSTGTGKTIFLNNLIMNLLYQPSTTTKSAGPESLRFILIDPKRVEFPVYGALPHLLCPIVYTPTQAVNVLKWLIGEMERRFGVLAQAHVRDINSFNENARKNATELLPFIIVVIDELADLMSAKGREVEAGIVRLAQMARASGIHLVVATQRPSVEVITGLIKANITSRVTFQVASQVDSRTVLDTAGAEKLLGAGDMLYISAETVKPKRIQAPYISEKEVRKVVSHIEANTQPRSKTEEEIILAGEMEKSMVSPKEGGLGGEGGEDDLYEEAKKVVLDSRKASASLLQRRLRVGYARAARLIDMLEERGMIGPADGAKPREVYGAKESLNEGVPLPNEENSSGDEEWKGV